MATGWKNDYLRYKDFFLNVLRVYQSKPNFKSFLEIILSLSTILLFSIFAIKPTILTIIELNKEIKGKEETVTKLKQKIKNLQAAGSLLLEKQNQIKYVMQSVPPYSNVDDAVGQIQGYATLSSVEILGISSSEVLLYGDDDSKKTKEDSLPQSAGQVPVAISVTGTYQNLSNFLKSIENLRRPLKVDSFSLSSSRTETGTTLVLVITGRLPYLMEKQ